MTAVCVEFVATHLSPTALHAPNASAETGLTNAIIEKNINAIKIRPLFLNNIIHLHSYLYSVILYMHIPLKIGISLEIPRTSAR